MVVLLVNTRFLCVFQAANTQGALNTQRAELEQKLSAQRDALAKLQEEAGAKQAQLDAMQKTLEKSNADNTAGMELN